MEPMTYKPRILKINQQEQGLYMATSSNVVPIMPSSIATSFPFTHLGFL
jgi:hypothetical protein